MPKIAILFTDDQYYDEYSSHIARNMTEWAEVTDEQLKILTNHKHLLPYAQQRFVVIQSPENQQEAVEEKVQDILERIEKEKIASEKRKKQWETTKEEAKKKRELKALAKLKEKYENDAKTVQGKN